MRLRNTMMMFLAGLLAGVLAGCGGGGGANVRPDMPEPPPRPESPTVNYDALAAEHLSTARFTTHQPRVLEQVGAHHAYARGLTGSGVRIGIEDTVLDYTGGLEDIETKTLRTIGAPEERLREDPVRILRAMRFAAKLGFDLDPETRDAIAPMSELLTAIPPARLFDEFNKLFMNGHAVAAWSLMWEFGLPEILFPLSEEDDGLVRAALESTDGRVAEDKPVTPGFLLAAMCWPEFQRRTALSATANNAADERLKAAHSVIGEQQLTIAFPRRLSMFIRDVWRLQSSLERRPPRNLKRTLGHPRFRAAYDFLVLRAETGEADPELAQWWTDVQETSGEDRASTANPLRPAGRRRRRRRGRGRPNPEPAP